MSILFFGKLIDRAGGAAQGVGLAIVQQKAGHEDRVLVAGVSDANGGFLLRFERPIDAATYRLAVSTQKHAVELPDLRELGTDKSGPHMIVIENGSPASPKAAVERRPMLVDPDALVSIWKSAPGLFTRTRPAHSNNCAPLPPSDVPARVFNLNTVREFPPQPERQDDGLDTRFMELHALPRGGTPSASQGTPLPASSWLDPVSTRSSRLRFGMMSELRQEWWDFGQVLGSLLYSIPLAPCEETKIATVDWRRKDYATKQSALDEHHFQDTTLTRDQSIDETMRMFSQKNIGATTDSSGGSVSIGPVAAGGAKTGATVAETIDSNGATARDVHDRTVQVSNTVRNTRAFSVVEASQSEESTVRTRVIRNHNHCHTVTFQYFEVLQVYLLRTKVTRVWPIVLVPFEPLVFNLNVLTKHGYLLRRALIDTTLEKVFDEFLAGPSAAAQAPSVAPTQMGNSAPTGSMTTAFRVRVWTSAPLSSIPGQSRPALSALWFVVDDQSYNVTWTRTPTGHYSAELFLHVPVTGLSRLGFWNSNSSTLSDSGTIGLDDVTFEANVDGNWVELMYRTSIEIAGDRRLVLPLESAMREGKEAEPAPLELTRLLAHLNANAVYYTATIISAGDAGLRYEVLASLGGGALSLMDLAENVVVGTIGASLALPLKRYDDLPSVYRGSVEEKDLTFENSAPAERLVTLPSPGVFAEAQLGQCSACETIDDTRFWNWQTSPCPDEAPAITPEMLASRYQSPAQVLEVVRSDLRPEKIEVPTIPEPMIKIGDATMAQLVSGLSLPDAQSVLQLIGGLAQIGSQHSLEVFKEIWRAYTGKAGGPGSGQQNAPTSQAPQSESGGNLPVTSTV